MSVESDLNEEIINSQAMIYYQRLEAIKINYYVFQKNFEELKTPLENMKDPKKSLPIWDVDKRDRLDLIQFEIIRRLLNYIFSAKALVDYTRNMINGWYEDSEFKSLYDSEIKKRFENNDVVGFIEDLRNYSSHYSLPVASPCFSISGENPNDIKFSHSFIISKTVLLKWKRWDKGKRYINDSPEDIEVEKFSYEYFYMIEDFHHWLYKKLSDLHKDDLKWINKKSEELRSLLGITYRGK